MLRTPDGHGEVELATFHSPPTPAGDPHAPSNRHPHLSLLVDYVRGPEGIIVELAEEMS